MVVASWPLLFEVESEEINRAVLCNDLDTAPRETADRCSSIVLPASYELFQVTLALVKPSLS